MRPSSRVIRGGFLVLLAGCGSVAPEQPDAGGADSGDGDSAPDSGGDGGQTSPYLEPRYLPDICDQLATLPSLEITTTASFDTNLDASCTGGVVAQLEKPDICVVRYGTFTLDDAKTLTVTGSRALAIVTDGDLQIVGTLDAAAHAGANGPGGGTRSSGGISTGSNAAAKGGGGAGFRQIGGDGGSATQNGGGAAGGPALSANGLASLIGGPKSDGGGGGAVTLISCRGAVVVSGTIGVGGGGGIAGFDVISGPSLGEIAGYGGGAGGQVLLQGLDVRVTGSLFANGGGGGSGAPANDLAGDPGDDGSFSSTSCTAGGVRSPGGAGGKGGCGANPQSGQAPSSSTATTPGGGGGSAGFLFVYVPEGVTPTLLPAEVSPALSPTLIAPTRR